MATTIFNVNQEFPNGLNLSALILEMIEVWPADVFPADYSANGKRTTSGVRTGTLKIETRRDLTSAEVADALAHFEAHAGGSEEPGLVFAALPPASMAKGRSAFVADVPQASGPGSGIGTMLYSDGIVWRRFSNDRPHPPGS